MARAVHINPMNQPQVFHEDDAAVYKTIVYLILHEQYGNLMQPIKLSRLYELAKQAGRSPGSVSKGMRLLSENYGLITITATEICLTDQFKGRFITVED